MATRISFFKRPGDYQNNYRNETIYFKDSKARETLEGKQKKLTAGRGLKLVGNTLSLADDISSGSSLKYFTVDGLLGEGYYEGAETVEIDDKQYSKFSVQFTYLGNPQVFINYANQDSHEYATLKFVSELSSGVEANKQKAVEAISNLEATDDDYFCLIPVRVISGELSREVKGYNDGNIEACFFADWYIDEYGEKQSYSEIQGSTYSDAILPVIWKYLAG
jgi:hypothetical protein